MDDARVVQADQRLGQIASDFRGPLRREDPLNQTSSSRVQPLIHSSTRYGRACDTPAAWIRNHTRMGQAGADPRFAEGPLPPCAAVDGVRREQFDGGRPAGQAPCLCAG